jgi:multidrug efflux pump
MLFARFSVRNPLLVNLAMVTIMLVGAYAFVVIPREGSPDINFNWAFVTVPYPGAAPEEVEQLVTVPLEDAIDGVDKISMVTSTSDENLAFISVKFEQNLSEDEFDKRFLDLRQAVDTVRLPDGAEDADVRELNTQDWWPVISVVVSGDASERELKRIAEELDELIRLDPDVSQVTIAGKRDREIWVEVDPDRVEGVGLSVPQVAQAITMRNMNVPGGVVEASRTEFLLRTMGQFGSVDDIGRVIVRAGPGGEAVRVSDVATVSDRFEDHELISRLDGEPSITLNIAKKAGASTLDVVKSTRAVVTEYRGDRLPGGARLALVNDQSIFINDIMGRLQMSAALGIVLVLISLWLFLGWRAALVVVIGMPVTFATTSIFIRFTGGSLDGNALFGLVLVLGMVVDHAIVMVENCVRHLDMGKEKARAVVDGIGEVFQPVVASTATTIAAFLPLMLMPGIMGAFLRIIPIVVTLALVASNIEAFLILPAHVVEWARPTGLRRELAWFRAIRLSYARTLAWVLRRRYWVVGAFLIVAVSSAGLVPLVGVDMFTGDELSYFFVRVWMPQGTKLSETDDYLRQIEALAMDLPPGELEAVMTAAGMIAADDGTITGTHVGQIVVDVVEQRHRQRDMEEILAELRLRCQWLAGHERIEFAKVEEGPPTGKAVEVKVKGKRFDELQALVAELTAELEAMPGVYDVGDNFSRGKEEIRVRVDEERARMHGLDVAQVAGQVRAAVDGVVATTYRDGDDEVDILVKLRGADGASVQQLEALTVGSLDGPTVPLREVATLEVARGYSAILRFEGARAITLSADVDSNVTTAVKVNQALKDRFAALSGRYPGYSLDYRGEFAEFQEAFGGLARLFVVGVFIIFLLLTAQFKSLTQPLIILFTVPFAFFGAVIGLIVIKAPFSLMTLYGIVALAGIVVNDSIVLIDFINRRRRVGVSRWRAIMKGGSLRLRPVILTSVTTVMGLMPMALGIGGTSQTWRPLANTIVWGLSMATFLTLFIIPALYAISDDVAWIQRRRARAAADTSAVAGPELHPAD